MNNNQEPTQEQKEMGINYETAHDVFDIAKLTKLITIELN